MLKVKRGRKKTDPEGNSAELTSEHFHSKLQDLIR
jgi:hypothetical protein